MIVGYMIYSALRKPNVWINNQESASLFIPTGSDYEDVKTILYSNGFIINRNNFEWVADRKKYPELVKPGHYIIQKDMNNDALLNMLRSGEQTPVKVIFNYIRTKEQLANKIGSQIETDSLSIISLLNDSVYISQFELTPTTLLSLFIPNTYQFFWNTTASQFLERMNQEYIRFWNHERKEKAGKLNLSDKEVITLASIIEKETSKNDEKPRIAGVYINRLDENWYLQADPTLIYAIGDYSIKRVLNKHKRIDSPYNTYKYAGLPPGPICAPSISSIDAVLNYENHNYMFFCAKDDMSGYHAFAETGTQHNANARKYQRALDKLNIRE